MNAIRALMVWACVAPASASAAPPLVVDGHNDLFVQYMDCKACPRGLDAYDLRSRTAGDTDIPRLRAGGVGAMLLNVFSAKQSTKDTLAAFDFLRQLQARYADTFEVAATAADVRRIRADGKIALIPMMEGANRLENSPMMVRTLHRLGLRAVTLAYETNDLADAANDDPRHGGLSDLGRRIVQEMNRTGVLVDISHVSAEAMRDVLDVSTAPVIFSHSSAKALVDVERNVPDDVLRRLPANGGIVMVSFVPYFTSRKNAEWVAAQERLSDDLAAQVKAGTLSEAAADKRWERWPKDNPEPVVTVSEVVDHIDYVRSVAGIDHVGLGSDFDGMPHKINGLEDVSGFPKVLAELRRRGWTEAEIAKVAGENFLRVMEAAEDVSRASAH
jgi:membrane dipeptidase